MWAPSLCAWWQEQMLLQDEARVWLSQQPQDLTIQAFADRFLESWVSLVRFKSHEARQALHERRVTQRRSEDVSAYYARFLGIVGQAKDMSITDQVHWFLGMREELIASCAVQLNGQPWHSPQDLVHYAVGAEVRLKAQRAAADRFHSARSLSRAHLQATPGSFVQAAAGPSSSSGSRPCTYAGFKPKQGGGAGDKRPSTGTQTGPPSKCSQPDLPRPLQSTLVRSPNQPNNMNSSITNQKAADRILGGRCIFCNREAGQHAPYCWRASGDGKK